MPEFLNDTNNLTLTGNYAVGRGGLFIPSGATVQEFGTIESSLIWIEPSGKFAIYEATSGWMLSSTTPAGPSFMQPNDASVSGELRFWFQGGYNNGLGVETPGQSGASRWYSPMHDDTFLKSGTPYIASGDINDVDCGYCLPPSHNFVDTTPQAASIDAFKGTNKPFTCMAVFKPQALGTFAVFSMASNGHSTNSQLMFGMHANGTTFFLKRGDTSNTLVQVFNGMA